MVTTDTKGMADPAMDDTLIVDSLGLEGLGPLVDGVPESSLAPNAAPASVEPEPEPIVLQFEDLLPDADGRVVLFAEDDMAVNIVTTERIADSGIVEDHVTADGLDVSGLHYYSFENGVTVYSLSDLVISEVAVTG